MLSVLLAVFSFLNVAAAAPCPQVAFRGYKYQKTVGKTRHYFNSALDVTLTTTCLAPKETYEKAVEELSKESSVRNTATDAVYFEFSVRGRYQRVYLVARKPVFKLTFTTRRRHRAVLDETQALIEKQFKKSKSLTP